MVFKKSFTLLVATGTTPFFAVRTIEVFFFNFAIINPLPYTLVYNVNNIICFYRLHITMLTSRHWPFGIIFTLPQNIRLQIKCFSFFLTNLDLQFHFENKTVLTVWHGISPFLIFHCKLSLYSKTHSFQFRKVTLEYQ